MAAIVAVGVACVGFVLVVHGHFVLHVIILFVVLFLLTCVLQNCGAAVLSLGSAPHITHLSLPPHAFHPSLSLAGPHR